MGETATYILKIDWDGDGDFIDAGEDVSSDWMHANIQRGFASPIARMAGVGRAMFTLNNQDKSYSPPLDANVLPRREVEFTMTYDGTDTVIFRGFIDSIRPTFGTKLERRVAIDCVDAMALLDKEGGDIALQTNAYADDIIGDIVSAVYTPPGTAYDAGINLFKTGADRWTYAEGIDPTAGERPMQHVHASRKIGDACLADWGRFFIAGSGATTYYNRHQMPLDTSTELTLDDDMIGLEYRKEVGSVHNYIEVTCHPRVIGEVYEVLGRISQRDAPRINESASRTFDIRFRDPANPSLRAGGKDCVTPVATTDYQCTSDPEGEGDDETGNVSVSFTAYGNHAEVQLTNAAAYSVYVQKLQVRGYAVRVREPIALINEDATSQASYRKRKLTLDATLMSCENDAQMLADYLLDRYKDPYDDISGVVIQANSTATLMAAARDLDLMDKIVITESQTGLSAYEGFVYALGHRIENKYNHRLILALQEAYDVGTPFRLGDAFNSGYGMVY